MMDDQRYEIENNIKKDDFEESLLLLYNKNNSIINEKNDFEKSFNENSQSHNLLK